MTNVGPMSEQGEPRMTFMLRIVNDPGAANGISNWPLCPCQYCGYLLNSLLRHNGPFPTAQRSPRATP